MRKALGLVVGLALLAGCSTGWHQVTREEIAQPDVCLAYGFMDMSEAPSKMDYFVVKQTQPPRGHRFGFETDHGLFYYLALPQGGYTLDEFGGTNKIGFFIFVLKRTLHRYDFFSNQTHFTLNAPGLYYLGSYKYVPNQDSFNIETKAVPSEGDLLLELLPKISGTKWEPQVRDRLAALGVRPPQ